VTLSRHGARLATNASAVIDVAWYSFIFAFA